MLFELSLGVFYSFLYQLPITLLVAVLVMPIIANGSTGAENSLFSTPDPSYRTFQGDQQVSRICSEHRPHTERPGGGSSNNPLLVLGICRLIIERGRAFLAAWCHGLPLR